ncbi:MAG: WYL domain-containing protein [Actinomycetota bacterium]
MTTKAETRLRRLLVMLPWLMERGEVPLEEVATRFDASVDELEHDLELVAMCGLPPFVDEMVDVFIDDGVVVIGVPRLFTRPLRLTAPEGFTLLTAGRAAMQLPGADPAGPLASGLAKIGDALHDIGIVDDAPGDDTAGLVLELDRPALVDTFVDAVADGDEFEIVYYSPASDTTTTRRVVPRHVFADGGHWYVVADDDRSGERRTFRIDRIDDATRTGGCGPALAAPVDRPAFFDDDVPRATLRLRPPAQWVREHYAVDSVEVLRDGRLEVVLPMSSERWLSRLLLRLGDNAECVSPSGAVAGAAALAVAIRERYDGAAAASADVGAGTKNGSS